MFSENLIIHAYLREGRNIRLKLQRRSYFPSLNVLLFSKNSSFTNDVYFQPNDSFEFKTFIDEKYNIDGKGMRVHIARTVVKSISFGKAFFDENMEELDSI